MTKLAKGLLGNEQVLAIAMKDITFITGNENKAEQVKKYLGLDIKREKIDLTEIQSLNLEEIIEQKAKEAFRIVGSPCLVEDVSFIIPVLGKLPGTLIKWFESEIGNEKICKMLNVFDDRTAIVEIAFGLYDGEKLRLFKHTEKGTIAKKPAGDKGFGFDFIFIPEGYNITRAQMSQVDYDETSHRRAALEKVQKFLTSSLN